MRRPPGLSAACSFSASACAAVRGLAPFFLRGVDCLRFLISWGFSKYLRRRVCGKEGSREGRGQLGSGKNKNDASEARLALQVFRVKAFSPRTRPGGGARGRPGGRSREGDSRKDIARASFSNGSRVARQRGVVEATGTHLVDVTGRHHRPAEATNRGLPVLVLADGNLGVRGRGEEGSAPAGYDSSASRVSGGVSRLGTARHGSRGLWARVPDHVIPRRDDHGRDARRKTRRRRGTHLRLERALEGKHVAEQREDVSHVC